MVLEIHFGEGYAFKKGCSGKVWTRARRIVLSCRDWVGIFKAKTRFEIGHGRNIIFFNRCHGRRIKFWHDVWCSNVPLMYSFPLLFSFATSKEAWVDNVQEVEGEMVMWNASQDIFKIGRWIMLRSFFEEKVAERRTRWFGRLAKVGNSWLSLSTLPWN